MFTIEPPPRSIIIRPAACENRKTPVRLTSRTFCQPSSGVSSAGAPHDVPALLTRTSRRPSSSIVRSQTACTSAGSRTSQRMPRAFTPSSDSSAAACSQRSTLRAQRTRFAPSSAKASAICRPIPVPPPVTIAVLPERSNRSWTRIDAMLNAVAEQADLRAAYRSFMEEHIYPVEEALARDDEESERLLQELRARAKAAGLWAPLLPPEAGGTGRGFLSYADLNEEIGRVAWAQYVFNCQAPDAGNGEILQLYGTDEQKERWLKPLVEGEARSFFSMTEPDVSGADPTGLRTTARLEDGEWVIDGHKWFSSGAEGAAFGIVMAVTEPEEPPHRRMSQILVPADAAGLTLPPVPGMGHRGRGST